MLAVADQPVVGDDRDVARRGHLERVRQRRAVDRGDDERVDALDDHVLDLRELVGDVVLGVLQVGVVAGRLELLDHRVAVRDPARRGFSSASRCRPCPCPGRGRRPAAARTATSSVAARATSGARRASGRVPGGSAGSAGGSRESRHRSGSSGWRRDGSDALPEAVSRMTCRRGIAPVHSGRAEGGASIAADRGHRDGESRRTRPVSPGATRGHRPTSRRTASPRARSRRGSRRRCARPPSASRRARIATVPPLPPPVMRAPKHARGGARCTSQGDEPIGRRRAEPAGASSSRGMRTSARRARCRHRRVRHRPRRPVHASPSAGDGTAATRTCSRTGCSVAARTA